MKGVFYLEKEMIPIAGLEPESIVDGPGYRFTIFTQGCPHNCKGCHNPQTHPMKADRYLSAEEIISKIDENRTLIDGITLSGGEPFIHAKKLVPIAKWAHKNNLNVMAYTGYLFEDLLKNPDQRELLNHIDILADGKFEIDKKSLTLLFVGSSNQRLIDVPESLRQGNVVLWKTSVDEWDFEGGK